MRFYTYTHRNVVLAIFLGVVAWVMTACNDEQFDVPDNTISGQPVTLQVKVAVPKMETKTRAGISDGLRDHVETLWVRTYSSLTGTATSKWVKLTPNTNDTEVGHPIDISIDTQSGYNYIVGVANVENLGVLKSNPTDSPVAISTLLEAADTWDKFLDIAVVAPSNLRNVYAPNEMYQNIPMAGCYIDIDPGTTHPTNLGEWQKTDFQAYFIPAQKNKVVWTNGAIHLRRLVSHITFNVVPSGDDADNMDITVNSYKVVNVPKFSWLYERPSENLMVANFGDDAEEGDKSDYYVTDGIEYTYQYVTKSEGISTFDFWQSENKHTGNAATYPDRSKLAAGSTADNKLFTSLTGESWTPNNMASYVLVSCTVDYKDQIGVGNQGQRPGDTDVYRTGNATFLIHLGYIGDGAEEDKSKDFNCYRNVNYTYNVNVYGLDDIRVDAWADQETYYGEEGIVSDLQYSTIDLDAHYHAFNIQLTQSELSDSNFGFIITTYKNNIQYNFEEMTDLTGVDENLYNWIELHPTSGPNVLAPYRPRFGENAGPDDNGKITFLLTDLKKHTENSTVWEAMTSQMRSDTEWYTVFVNEYTYEDMYTGATDSSYGNEVSDGDVPNWMSYVNQNPRRFYIRVTRSVSQDGNSVYARSKYGAAQQSIQTYYSTSSISEATTGSYQDFNGNTITYNTPAGSAIGIERINETEGLNMRANNGGGSDERNGRWNIAQYYGTSTSTGNYQTNLTNTGINNPTITGRPQWSSFINQTAPLEVGAVTGDRLQYGPPLPARTIISGDPHKLPAPVTFTSTSVFCDPQSANTAIEVMNACTNRNRDNNGNGRIDPEELRWYVPAMGKYLRLILGANSLGETPVMPFTRIPQLPKVNAAKTAFDNSNTGVMDNGYCTRYFFAASNRFSNNNMTGNAVLWGMEGLSTSVWGQWSSNPWQVRCIRNLGTDMRTVTNGDKTSVAYSRSGNVITMSYYDEASKRTTIVTGSNANSTGKMPIHISTSELNMVYSSFEYDTQNITIDQADWGVTATPAYIESNPCNARNTAEKSGWRVPNLKELVIMRNFGDILTGTTYNYWVSCTANYFNDVTGIGGTYTAGENYLMGVSPDKGLRMSGDNYTKSTARYIRCVRDVP